VLCCSHTFDGESSPAATEGDLFGNLNRTPGSGSSRISTYQKATALMISVQWLKQWHGMSYLFMNRTGWRC
jgi:hypothetical protein